MKKLVALIAILVISGIASATLVDVVCDGDYDDVNENGVLDASDIVYIKITTSQLLKGYDFDLHVSGPGTLSEVVAGQISQIAGGFAPVYSGISPANHINTMADATFGSFTGDLVWGLAIHCEGLGNVLVDLTIGQGNTETTGGYTLTEADLGDLTIPQVPEPMTVMLLGLGGLFLRRRRA